ncbi:MAG: glycosyltransferase [Propionibacteriaceae bacterium]|jgi:glycosyltransferase involved in cell wall biosynthesis|nr:glycosyltransferase [Propionibacteriaceae bacterium]
MDATAAKVALVIVTYKRPQLLAELFESVLRLPTLPYRVVVVDNASGDNTQEVIAAAAARLPAGVLVNYLSPVNGGGAGGFHDGVRLAYAEGAEWMWIMDDDVEILPEAFDRFEPWMARFKVLHGRRYDVDGSPFYWQARFNEFLGVPLPYSVRDFNKEGYALTNSGTFEGMLIHRDVVRKIGYPDPRFFISWDDSTYAWVASRHTAVAYVDAYVLRRKREQRQVNLGLRHLNDSSPLVKYHTMRNRGYVARYFAVYGRLNRVGFALGTALTLAKEIFRLAVVEHSAKGFGQLWRGLEDSKRLRQDPAWTPMPSLG